MRDDQGGSGFDQAFSFTGVDAGLRDFVRGDTYGCAVDLRDVIYFDIPVSEAKQAISAEFVCLEDLRDELGLREVLVVVERTVDASKVLVDT